MAISDALDPSLLDVTLLARLLRQRGIAIDSEVEARDYLFRNQEGTFVEVTPEPMIERGSSHGVAWADFDGDGDVDLALANNHAEGHHPLYRNLADPAGEARALAVHVTDADGRWTRSGARRSARWNAR